MKIFEIKGLRPVPAPTNFLFKEGSERSAASYMPNPGNLALAKKMVYEQIGMLWLKLKTL